MGFDQSERSQGPIYIINRNNMQTAVINICLNIHPQRLDMIQYNLNAHENDWNLIKAIVKN